MKNSQRKDVLTLRSDHIVDIGPNLTRPRWLRLAFGLLILTTLGVISTVWGYREIYKPYQLRTEIERSLAWFDQDDPLDDRSELSNLPEIRQLERIGSILPYRPKSVPFKDRSIAAVAALELADHLGSPAARYIYGEHLHTGVLTAPDKSSAEVQFSLAHKLLSPKVAQGDPRATLYYGLMLNAGFGIRSDPKMSFNVFKRVLDELDQKDLQILLSRLVEPGENFNVPDNEAGFLEFIAASLIKKGGTLDQYEVYKICEPRFNFKTCEKRLNIALKKNEDKETGVSLANPSVRSPQNPSKRAVSKSSPSEKEIQSFTGYIEGALQSAQDGLSTFTVDNNKGNADAIARLYFNGSKPAARSMYVRAGDTFRAESLSPGNYIFRYRFIGSEDTYEADRLIVLKEIKNETGTQFSNVTVTLFKAIDGNLNTKKVSADKF